MKADCIEEEIRIGDKSGYKFTTTSKTGRKGISTALYNNKRVYLIEPFYPPKCRSEECDIYNKIISTFKLIEIKSSTDQDLSCEYKKGNMNSGSMIQKVELRD